MAKQKKGLKKKIVGAARVVNATIPQIDYYILFDGEIKLENTTKLLRAIIYNATASKASRIIIFFSSWGGSIYEGFKLATTIQNSKIPAIIHATNNIDSIANVVYLSAKERTAESHAKFYLHGASVSGSFDEGALKDKLSATRTNNSRIAYFISENTKILLNKVKSLMKMGVTISAQDALKYGITHEVIHGEIPPGSPREDIIDIE